MARFTRPIALIPCLVLSCCGATQAFAQAAPPGLYSLGTWQLLRYPTTGGVGTVVANFHDEVPGVYGTDFSASGTLYAIGGALDPSRYTLYAIDPTNGSVQTIGDTGFPNTRSLAINSHGNAFGLQSSYDYAFYHVNLQTAQSTLVANSVTYQGQGIRDLTFDKADGLFGVVGNTPSTTRIVRIDPVTGGTSLYLNVQGIYDHALYGIAFNENDDLFGIAQSSSTGFEDLLYRIDRTTGQATSIPISPYGAAALAHYLPEPSCAVSLLLGTSLLRRRR